MFRLLDSGLPKDPVYPADLKGLGYFINEEDEIRSIENPRAYFNFFLTKNERYNNVQREAMNNAIREEICKRLHDLGLNTIRLPLGAQEFQPNIPVFVSQDIEKKKRVIILFYEHTQDLGVFAHRVIGGRGGINEGSAVNFVKHIQSLPSGPDNNNSPGIILANMGQMRWWRRGKKAVTQTTWFALPQRNAVSGPIRFDPVKNVIPENRNVAEHVDYIFKHVVKELLDPKAKLDVIGVTDGAVQVVEFMNRDQNWDALKHRMNAIALLASFHRNNDLKNPEFAAWLRKRGRAYMVSQETANVPVARPDGGPYSTGLGCAAYSVGEPYYSELMLPKGYKTVLEWLQQVAHDPEYENEEVYIFEPEQKQGWGSDDEQNKGWQLKDEEGMVGKMTEVNAPEAKVDNIEKAEAKAADVNMELGKAKADADKVQRDLEAVKANTAKALARTSELSIGPDKSNLDDTGDAVVKETKAADTGIETGGIKADTEEVQLEAEAVQAKTTEAVIGISEPKIDTDKVRVRDTKGTIGTMTTEAKADATEVQPAADAPKAKATEVIPSISSPEPSTTGAKASDVKKIKGKAKPSKVDTKPPEIIEAEAELQALRAKLQTWRAEIEADKARCMAEKAALEAQAQAEEIEAESAGLENDSDSTRFGDSEEGVGGDGDARAKVDAEDAEMEAIVDAAVKDILGAAVDAGVRARVKAAAKAALERGFDPQIYAEIEAEVERLNTEDLLKQ